MNPKFSKDFKDFLKLYPEIPKSDHYKYWIFYSKGKIEGLNEERKNHIEKLKAEIQKLQNSINSTNLNLPSKQDALPDNLLGCDGRKFRCKIHGKLCEGSITVVDKCVFLCQNEMRGVCCEDKKGYEYSWSVLTGSQLDLDSMWSSVNEFELID